MLSKYELLTQMATTVYYATFTINGGFVYSFFVEKVEKFIYMKILLKSTFYYDKMFNRHNSTSYAKIWLNKNLLHQS